MKRLSFFLIVILLSLSLMGYLGKFGAQLVLIKSSFAKLPQWQEDDQSKALQAFKQSCRAITKLNPTADLSALPHSGKAGEWQSICRAANQIDPVDKKSARAFFELWFQPYRVTNNLNAHGLFTGYYLPLLHGSLTRDAHYNIPIYALPKDLVKINLGSFNQSLKGKTVIGKLQKGILKPYPDRAAIEAGALQQSAHVLAWSDSPIDVFFAQIQGSALIQLTDHRTLLLSYAGHNGHPYTAIGKVLIQRNALPAKNLSMQMIRAWLTQHPDQMTTILNQNASYVFFDLLKQDQPCGTQAIPLSPERSLAVDTHYIPLGVPVWLKTNVPTQASTLEPFHQLLVAQDSGGAIKGIVRGDVFWGAGDKAAEMAGHMQSPGQYWLLLPKKT